MEEALVALLGAQSSITTLVGTNPKRIYSSFVPDYVDEIGPPDTAEHILITELGSDEHNDLSATGALRQVNLDVDCFAREKAEAVALGKVVRQFIDDYTGTAGSETIKAVIVNSSRRDFVPPVDGSQRGWFSTTTNMDVFYVES